MNAFIISPLDHFAELGGTWNGSIHSGAENKNGTDVGKVELGTRCGAATSLFTQTRNGYGRAWRLPDAQPLHPNSGNKRFDRSCQIPRGMVESGLVLVKIIHFQSKRFTKGEVLKIIAKSRYWLNNDVKIVDGRLGWLQQQFELSGSEIRQLIVLEPRLIAFGTGPLQV